MGCSILGHLLYTNDLVDIVSQYYVLNILVCSYLEKIEVLHSQLNEDLRDIKERFNSNKLPQNVPKTDYIIFTSRYKIIQVIDVQLYGVNMQRVFVTKCLVVQIDFNLTWKHHIEYIVNKSSKCVGIICKAIMA